MSFGFFLAIQLESPSTLPLHVTFRLSKSAHSWGGKDFTEWRDSPSVVSMAIEMSALQAGKRRL